VAVGMTLRRLVSKIANRWGSARMSPTLAPRQLGVGTLGGVEASIHAAIAFLDSATASQALLKLYFANAFNTVRCDSFIEAVAENLPTLMAYVSSSYESPPPSHWVNLPYHPTRECSKATH